MHEVNEKGVAPMSVGFCPRGGWILLSLVLVLGLSAGSVKSEEKPTPAPTAQESEPFDQEQALAELRKKIAGKEKEPAEAVFEDIQLLKGVPAERLLRIMEIGYSRSLGVNCTHCHVPGKWESAEKPQKQITRDMAAM